MQLPGSSLQLIKSIPIYGQRLFELFNAVQQQATRIETQGNLNATGDPPVPPPPDALKVTNGPSGEFQIAITHNGQFNRGTSFHVQWDTSPHFTNPHNIDLGASRNDSSLNLPGQTAYFRASAASPSGANSAWTYHGSANAPSPVRGGNVGPRAPGMGSGTGAPGDQSGGPGPVQSRNEDSGYNWKAQQRTAGAGFGSSAQGTPAGLGASTISGGGGGGGSVVTSESVIAASETLTSIAGTGNAITGVTAIPFLARVNGFVLRYIPIHANSGATTINENSIGAVAITRNGTTALVGGELVIGRTYFLMWDGTEYQIVEPSFPVSATVLASDSNGNPSAAALPSGDIWQGNGSNLPQAYAVSGDATLAGGVLTFDTVNASPGTYTNATLTVNAKGLVTSASSGGSTSGTWTPILQFGGASTGITYSSQAGNYTRSGNLVFVTGLIILTSKGIATGVATIAGLPVASGGSANPAVGQPFFAVGVTLAAETMLFSVVPTASSSISVEQLTIGTSANEADATDANFTNTSYLRFSLVYSA